MRVCLYTRISTDEDHQPTSLTTQRERLERVGFVNSAVSAISREILNPWAPARPQLCIAVDKGFERVRERLPVISQCPLTGR
jgi:hypothetical protein